MTIYLCTKTFNMKLSVKVKPNSRENKVEYVKKDNFRISVKAPPKEGKANKEVIRLLSEYFKVPQSSIRILSGKTSKNKIVEINSYCHKQNTP